MNVISVNIGRAEPINNGKPSGQSGIFKRPVAAAVQVTEHGLTHDVICDVKNHGGVDQAVYIYGSIDYDWWSNTLGQTLQPGTFGENLTISELESGQFFIGDRFEIGSTLLEVTAPRVPCSTLAARMGDPTFVKRFRQAERPGLYCRVLQEGHVQEGDVVRLIRHIGETVSVLEMFRDFYEPQLDEATLRRYLDAPIAIRDRTHKEAQLQDLLGQTTPSAA